MTTPEIKQIQIAQANAPNASAPAESHGGGEGGHEGTPELENFWNVLARSSLNKEGTFTHTIIKPFDPYHGSAMDRTLAQLCQNVFFSAITVTLVIIVTHRAIRKRAMIPNRAQSVVEMLIEGMSNFFLNILGEKHGRRYLPFLLGLFFFILFNNLMGLVPFMKSSTNTFQLNIALGLCVFCYVQYIAMRHLGPKKYFLHFLGNPESPVMWAMAPFLLVLHILSELIRPLSLSLRLFGNVLGEDVLLAVFAGMGITIMTMALKLVGGEHAWVGFPLQLPFLFLATLTSTIQALIFSLLTCIYILLVLPHDEEGAH